MGSYKNISSTAIITQIRIELRRKEKRILLLWISVFWVMLAAES